MSRGRHPCQSRPEGWSGFEIIGPLDGAWYKCRDCGQAITEDVTLMAIANSTRRVVFLSDGMAWIPPDAVFPEVKQ